MKQMALRFFAYIWGAIIGTALAVVLLAAWLGLPPPGLVPVEAVGRVLSDLDPGRVSAILQQEPMLSERFFQVQTEGAACPAGACLRLEQRPTPFEGLQRLLPFVVPLTVGCGISLVLALMLARRFVRPIQRIGTGLTALSRGHLDCRIGEGLHRSEPAIADVGRAFDVAAGKLQDLTESRSRLFHDISHEIRSPLARLQAETALLRQNPGRLDAMLPRMEGDIARMNQLVEEILTLARLERGGTTPRMALNIDLIEVLDPILRDAEFEGQSRQIRIGYSGPDRLEMRCDPELLHRAFENILRNALRYAPDGTVVDVSVGVAEASVRVAICDRGPGVEDVRLASIFQAFVRDEAGQGIGLGLAIAANAIGLHGGTLRAENRMDGGLMIIADLPRGNGTPG